MLKIEVLDMIKRARLGLYIESEEIKKQIKIAATRRGMSTSDYCAHAIKEQLKRDGMADDLESRKALVARMDELRVQMKPLGITTAELVRESRRKY